MRVILLLAMLFSWPAEAQADSEAADLRLLEGVSPLGGSEASAKMPADGLLLLQFWASWCHSCGTLMWDMDEIASRNDRVEYLAVSLDDDARAADEYVRRLPFFERHPDRYFIDREKALSASLDVETVPSILVISPSGEVLVHKTGHLNSTDLRDISTAIGSLAKPVPES